MRSTVLRALLLLGLACPGPAWSADAGASWFAQGVEAFSAGRYEEARRAFEQARENGMTRPALDYNLGVTCYRLGDHAAAREHFRKLLHQDDWRPLALYNLGLVAEQQGSADQARTLFRRARGAGNARIARLAARKLPEAAPGPAGSAWFFSLGGGYDSNIELAPDDATRISDEGDSFGDVYASVRHPLDANWRIRGSAYVRRYAERSDFDESLLELGLDRRGRWRQWLTRVGPEASLIRIDGRTFQRRLGVAGAMERPLHDDNTLVLDGDWTLINANTPYQYLDGWRARGGASWLGRSASLDHELSYHLTLNARDDLRPDPDFYSYSPLSQEWEAGVGHTLDADWTLGGELAYEYAWYRDAHRIRGERIRREDGTLQLSVELLRRLSARWSCYLEARHERQRSTLDTYDYDRNLIQAGLEYQPR